MLLQDPVSRYRDLRAKLEVAITHTLELAQQQQQQQKEWQQNSSDSEEYTSDTDEVTTKNPDTAKPKILQQALDTEQLLVCGFFSSHWQLLWVAVRLPLCTSSTIV